MYGGLTRRIDFIAVKCIDWPLFEAASGIWSVVSSSLT